MRFLVTGLALCGAMVLTTQALAHSAFNDALDAYNRGDNAAAGALYQQACTGGDMRGCDSLAES